MGRSVVVTGATSGIGLATAMRLCRTGYEVYATARSQDKAEKLSARAEEQGLTMRCLVLDVTDRAACEEVLDEVAVRTGGGPWAVVNNAGVTVPRAVEDVDEVQARLAMEVNVHAPARISRLVLPAMRRRGEGRIVNVSSTAARVVLPFAGWYSASKAGLNALTHALRMETRGFGIHVTLVEPSFHASPLLEHAAQELARPSAVCDEYGASYRALAASLRESRRYPGPENAARIVQQALESRRPRACYRVGAAPWIGTTLDTVLPYTAGDHVKRAIAGLRASTALERRFTRLMGLPQA
ncbi:SDR family NAD(P)-dependent oxidoreductase [Streptomyces flavidovirens]|uniref:SDR family NAD(P)-dependent oxidoreductase n=1 Tax=Streptomyces flavidovirens TaxID=67298 RepID=UPI003674DE6E